MLVPEKKKLIKKRLDWFLTFIGFVSLALIIANAGFYLPESFVDHSRVAIDIIVVIYVLQEIVRIMLSDKVKDHVKERKLETLLSVILIANIVIGDIIYNISSTLFPNLSIKQLSLLYLAVVSFILFLAFVTKLLRYNYLISKINLHPGAILSISFLIIILGGTLVLLMPRATVSSADFGFLDALFTSTSAVCVTGLIVTDTATTFTFFGKFVILTLIQVGGLGIMTLTTFFAVFLSGGMSFRVRVLMKDLLSEDNISEVRGLLLKIAVFTFILEALGAASLYVCLNGNLSSLNPEYLYSSVFHSVSAFCNAGFSIYSDGLMDGLVLGNYPFLVIIMLLITLGGLGFVPLSNMFRYGNRFVFFSLAEKFSNRLRPLTKLVLVSSAVFTFGGALLIYISGIPDAGMGTGDKLFHSLFLSVTSRTAGFNTVPVDMIPAPALIIMLLLMWIGASPGSTGGGIKTTTISISFLNMLNLIKGRGRLNLFRREINPDSIRRAFMVISASIIVLFVGVFILILIEPSKNPVDLVFEVISAVGTVGLSRNITGFLGDGGKILIIFMMFIGRIGVLTFFMSFYRPGKSPRYTLPRENILVG